MIGEVMKAVDAHQAGNTAAVLDPVTEAAGCTHVVDCPGAHTIADSRGMRSLALPSTSSE